VLDQRHFVRLPDEYLVTLPTVPASALSAPGEVSGASKMGDIQMPLSGCAGLTIKAVARFENGPAVDQASGYLQNEYLGNGARRMSRCAC
jgi:major type 1 subunit fimbrin (pilin)